MALSARAATLVLFLVAMVGGGWPEPAAAILGPCGLVYVINTGDDSVQPDPIETGCTPEHLAASRPDATQVWSTNSGGGSSTVIRVADNQVIHTVQGLGLIPQGLAFTPQTATQPEGAFVWVASKGSGRIYVIDSQSYEVTWFSLGTHPAAIAFKPDGSAAYVTDDIENGRVWVVDIDSHVVLGSIPVLGHPLGVAISPPGEHAGLAYVADNGSAKVTIIDTTTDSVITDRDSGGGPEWVAFTPGGDRALVTNENSATVSVFSTSDHSKITDVHVAGGPEKVVIAQTPRGLRAYVSNEVCPPNGGVSDVDLDDPAYTTTYITSTGNSPEGLAVAAGGARVYVTDESPDPFAC